MVDLTIGYTYYSNGYGWNKIHSKYNALDCKRIVIDDASPTDPLLPTSGWDAYRINEDVGFNNEGARNLIVQLAETKWVLLLDMDHCLAEQSIDILQNGLLDSLDEDTMYFLNKSYPVDNNWRRGTMSWEFNHNNLLVTRDVFLRNGGYKIYIPGYYGLDGTLTKNKNIRRNCLPELELKYNRMGETSNVHKNNAVRGIEFDLFAESEGVNRRRYPPQFTEFMTWRKL